MNIEELMSGVIREARQAVENAYKQGFEDGTRAGERNAGEKIRARLSDFFDVDIDAEEPISSTSGNDLLTDQDQSDEQESTDDGRAPPGTVKPLVLKTIQASKTGMTIREITDVTGVKYNSVRGTVWTLKNEEKVKKGDGGRWMATTPLPVGHESNWLPLGAKANEPPDD